MRTSRLLALLAVALWAAAGCATAPDPPSPDLSSAALATELRHSSIDAAERTILDELSLLDEFLQSFDSLRLQAQAADLPLDLLRLVAMNCLNTEYSPGNQTSAGLSDSSLNCRPAHFDLLQQALNEGPLAARDTALVLLVLIDQIRILRANLRERLARLPRSLAEHREFIVEERASLRQREADLARRRTLYSNQGWWQVTDAFAAQRRRLRALDDRLDAVEEASTQWPQTLESQISSLYFALADMRRTSP